MTHDDTSQTLLAELRGINETLATALGTFSDRVEAITSDLNDAGAAADAAMTGLADWLEDRAAH